MEADRQEISPGALLKKEVRAKIKVGQDEIQAFIDTNRARLPKMPLPVLKERVKKLLTDRKTNSARNRYIQQLKEKYRVQFTLPLPPRIAIDANPRSGPEKGPADAPVTIIEFSDFECPFCGKTHQTLKELLQRYPGKIRLVFRHFPLDMHPMARKIAEYSYCVHQQGLFWPFADRAFAHKKELSEKDLMVIARDTGVDTDLFTACTRTDAGRAAVAQDIAEGLKWGLNSTPSLFVNGRYFAGLPKDLDAVIEAELANQ
jgi:protein-disulfide isomerase